MAIFRHHVTAGLPLSAGVTIYVAASDLVPDYLKAIPQDPVTKKDLQPSP